jgi:hypothetical protein
LASNSAIPLMPMPPMPTKCTRLVRPNIVTSYPSADAC